MFRIGAGEPFCRGETILFRCLYVVAINQVISALSGMPLQPNQQTNYVVGRLKELMLMSSALFGITAFWHFVTDFDTSMVGF